MKKKFRVVSRNTGIDYGTFEGENDAEVLEAFAQDISIEENPPTDIERCRRLVAEGSYDIIPV